MVTTTIMIVHPNHIKKTAPRRGVATVLIMKVSLFQRFINTHLYCIGTDTTCPDYRGVLILECPQ